MEVNSIILYDNKGFKVKLYSKILEGSAKAIMFSVKDRVFEPSYAYHRNGTRIKSSTRTSSSIEIKDKDILKVCRLNWTDHVIDNCVSSTYNIEVKGKEPFSILKYEPDQEYKPHYDCFLPAMYNDSLLANGGQRIITALLGLQKAREGGETYFPDIDLKVTLDQGDLLLFNSAKDSSICYRESRHGGLPVVNGTKYIMTRWYREDFYSQD